jgi:antitoxin CptB
LALAHDPEKWVAAFRKNHAQEEPGSPHQGIEAAMTERSSEGLDERRRKLLFRAWRRGVREMDLIVGRFADVYIDKFDEPALDQFERLIEVPNAALYAWVTGDETAPAEHDSAVLRDLIGFHAKTAAQRAAAAEEGR